jgi:zinc protease
MSAGAKFIIFITMACCVTAGFPQNQRPWKSSAKPQRAPFLNEAKSYETTPYVTRVVFKNGLKVLVNEFRAQPLVSLQTYVNGGISDESALDAGAASLLAAMIGRGDTNKKSGTIRQKVHAIGGSYDIHADIQDTQFEIVTPSAQWKQALNIQADALLHPVLEKESIKLEADLLPYEARSYLEDGSVFLKETLLETAFHQPKLSKYGLLSKSELASITPEKLTKAHKARFVPSEMMIVVSGDIRSWDVLNELVKIYATAESHSSTPVNGILKGEQKELKYQALFGDIPRPRLVFGFHTSSEKSQDYKAVEVLHALLGVGEGSTINTRLRDQKKLIVSSTSNLYSFPNSGFLSIELETDPANIDLSEIALLTEIELIKRTGPSETELRRALAQLERLYWTKLESVSGRAKMLAHFESLGDWKLMDRYVSDLKKVKAADVQKAAEQYLKIQNSTLVEFLPDAMKDRVLTHESIQKTLEGLLAPSTDQELQDRTKEVVLAIKIPEESPAFKFSEIQYPFQVASILRGPDIFIREEHTSPLIDMGVFFPGGKAKENLENAGITELMLNLLLRGNPEKQGAHRQQQLEIYGGKIQPVVTDDYFGFTFSILSANIESGFELLQEIIKTPFYDAAELERLKQLQAAKIASQKNSPAFMQQLIRAALFGSFSYALDSSGTETSIRSIKADAIKSWYDDNVRNRKPTVVIMGDTKGTSLASFFVHQFSGSRMLAAKISEDYVRPLEKAVSLERNGSFSSSCIFQAFQAPPKDDEDALGTRVLQNYLGGNGRFAQEIRDRQSLAYRIFFDYEPKLRGGSISIGAQSPAQNESEILKSIQREIQHLVNDPIPYSDFQSAVISAIGSNIIRNQYRSNRIADLAEYAFGGKTLEDYLGALENVYNVKEEEIKELAQRLLKADRSVLLRIHGTR